VRKVILILAALTMVISGVAAVSAYEAHVINVTAHVENALDVDTSAIEFGTVFPEEWLIETRDIALSESANTALVANGGDVENVTYEVWAEWKVDVQDPINHIPDEVIGGIDHYAWLGYWLWVGINPPNPSGSSLDSGWVNVGTPPSHTDYAKKVVDGSGTAVGGTLTDDTADPLKVMLLAPVFHTYYNSYTDEKPDWWPLDVWEANKLPAQYADGWDGGVDLKIQVTGVNRQ
jgi:hypothetical protein